MAVQNKRLSFNYEQSRFVQGLNIPSSFDRKIACCLKFHSAFCTTCFDVCWSRPILTTCSRNVNFQQIFTIRYSSTAGLLQTTH